MRKVVPVSVELSNSVTCHPVMTQSIITWRYSRLAFADILINTSFSHDMSVLSG